MNQKEFEAVFSHWSSHNPNPKTELNYKSNFELLVAVVLSAQATDKGVNKVTEHLFAIANTPEKIVKMGHEALEDAIKTIGLFRSKAKNVFQLSQILVSQHNGQVPDSFEALINLPGVGRKTADVVLNVLFDKPTIAVDTHIFRVANRMGMVRGKTPDDVADKLPGVIPSVYLKNAHHWMILHGRYICQARKPQCNNCQVREYCKYFKDVVGNE